MKKTTKSLAISLVAPSISPLTMPNTSLDFLAMRYPTAQDTTSPKTTQTRTISMLKKASLSPIRRLYAIRPIMPTTRPSTRLMIVEWTAEPVSVSPTCLPAMPLPGLPYAAATTIAFLTITSATAARTIR